MSMLESGQIIQMLSSLFGIIILILVATFLLKRFGKFQPTEKGELSIVNSLSLGTKEKLLVVQIGQQQLLLGVSAQQINMLHVLPTPLTTSTANELKIASEHE